MTVTPAMCSLPESANTQSQSLLSNGGSPHHLAKSSPVRWEDTGRPPRAAWTTDEDAIPPGPRLLITANNAMTTVSQDMDTEDELSMQGLCQCPQHSDDYMFVNLRGVRFAVFRSHLNRRPKSRLALLTKSDANYSHCDDEFYFDRNPSLFNSVLDFYSQGEMHLPTNVCIQAFRRELEYWKLEAELLAPCCWSKYRKAEEEERTLARIQKEWGSFGARIYTDFDEQGNKVPTMQRIWIFLNEPQTSFAAKVSIC